MATPLYTTYKDTVVPALKEQFGYKSVMEVPKIDKITLNVGYGRHHKDKPYMENVEKTLRVITGQQPMHNLAKKSISNFKIREGMPVGASVTLRGDAMYDFLYRLIHLALPRVQDFRGVGKKSFDKQGNYSLGIKDSGAFPEITGEAADRTHGLEIVVTTTATNQDEGYALLEKLGFPFKK
jgi:large subunit ribosomal protein L5